MRLFCNIGGQKKNIKNQFLKKVIMQICQNDEVVCVLTCLFVMEDSREIILVEKY